MNTSLYDRAVMVHCHVEKLSGFIKTRVGRKCIDRLLLEPSGSGSAQPRIASGFTSDSTNVDAQRRFVARVITWRAWP